MRGSDNHKPIESDIAYVKANYSPGSIERLARGLKLTDKVVSGIVRELGLKEPPRLWTDQEVSFLRDNYGKLTYEQIADALGMTLKQVQTKRSLLKVPLIPKFWTSERLDYLQRIGPTKSYPELAKDFGLAVCVVKRMGSVLKIPRPVPPWTEQEDQYLVNNYGTMSGEEIGKVLGRSRGSILHRASRLGIHRTPEEFARLQFTTGSLSDQYIAKHSARKKPEIQQRLLQYPELLNLRKHQIILNRLIKNASKPDQS